MQTLVIIDAQNEFAENGQRPVPMIREAVEMIKKRVEQARKAGTPIAWVRHFNRPDESPAFMPGTWGAEFLPGLEPDLSSGLEKQFFKDVFGAFTGTAIEAWLKEIGSEEILMTGFYTHGCVSTTSREALMAGLTVKIDPAATGTRAMEYPGLGELTAEQSRAAAVLHLQNMGVIVDTLEPVASLISEN